MLYNDSAAEMNSIYHVINSTINKVRNKVLDPKKMFTTCIKRNLHGA